MKKKKSKEQGGLFAAFCTGTHQNRVLIAWASRVWATRTGGPTSECKALRKLLQPSTRTRPQPRSPETWTETGKKQQCCFSATSISMKLSLVTYDIKRKLKHLDSWTASEAPSGRTSGTSRDLALTDRPTRCRQFMAGRSGGASTAKPCANLAF